jgi:hypothetical protein
MYDCEHSQQTSFTQNLKDYQGDKSADKNTLCILQFHNTTLSRLRIVLGHADVSEEVSMA